MKQELLDEFDVALPCVPKRRLSAFVAVTWVPRPSFATESPGADDSWRVPQSCPSYPDANR
jgi:hypothetical protein